MAICLASIPLSQWLAHTNVTVIDVYCCFKQNDLSLGVINMTRKHGARNPTNNTEKKKIIRYYMHLINKKTDSNITDALLLYTVVTKPTY